MGTLHQQSRQEKHDITLSTSCSAKIGSTFSVALRLLRSFNIVKQGSCSVILWIATDNLLVFFGSIGNKNKVLNNVHQPFFIQHPPNQRLNLGSSKLQLRGIPSIFPKVRKLRGSFFLQLREIPSIFPKVRKLRGS